MKNKQPIKKTLDQRRIVITRAPHQTESFRRQLEEHGATPISLPAIQIVPPPSWDAVDHALDHLSSFDWLVLTSTNGVRFLCNRLDQRSLRIPSSCKIASVGPATTEELENHQISVDLQPEETFRTRTLGKKMNQTLPANQDILLLRSNRANPELQSMLKDQGHQTSQENVYRLEKNTSLSKEEIQQRFTPLPDLLTFASSMTVEHFHDIVKSCLSSAHLQEIPAACIGPVTAKTARKHNYNVEILPDKYTIPALTEAIVQYYSNKKSADR